MPERLHPDDVEAIARRSGEIAAQLVLAALEGEAVAARGRGPLVTPLELAERFGVSRDWIYDHAEELGVIRMGQGPKAPLRFDPELAAAAMAARVDSVTSEEPRSAVVAGSPARRRRRLTSSGAQLLPIRGERV